MNTDHITSRPEQGAKIDWSAIRQRAEAAGAASERGAARTSEENRSVLKARARALAQESQGVAAAQEFMEIIEFRLASETYGLEAAFVRRHERAWRDIVGG